MRYKALNQTFELPGSVNKSVDIGHSHQVVLLNTEELSPSDRCRNVFLLSNEGEISWQIGAVDSSSPPEEQGFWSNIWLDDSAQLRAYHFTGWEAQISLDDGSLTKRKFIR